MTTLHSQSLKICDLKSNLRGILRAVRAGQQFTVCDGDTPVARIVPCHGPAEGLVVRRAVRALHEFRRPAPIEPAIDSRSVLMAERESAR